MRTLREEQVDPVDIMLRHHGRCEAIIRQAISLRTLIYFARTDAAGLVLGAGVPIILTSRAVPAKASAALAMPIAAKRLEARMPP